MMRVLILSPTYRDRYGADHKRGDLVEYEDRLGAKLIAHGIAAAAPLAPPVETAETAEQAPPENAAKRTTKPKPRARKQDD